MKAIAVMPGTPGARVVERPEPELASPHHVKVQILRVGVCGTDREEAAGGRSLVPKGANELVIGHESFGRVVEVGSGVTRVRVGDYAAFTVRRGCGTCMPCMMHRSDMCRTGDFHERGIWGLDGFQTERVVDHEDYVVRVPPELESTGVLIEPLTVAEKAVDVAVSVQKARLPEAGATPNWLFGRRVLVAGLGPVGLLGALVLVLRGADVYGIDVVDEDSARPRWLAAIGGRYVDGRRIKPHQLVHKAGPMDLIFEATGVPSMEFALAHALGQCGAYVLTGIPAPERRVHLKAGEFVDRLVLQNLLLIGSVNAARDHFQYAVDDLYEAHMRWGAHVSDLITHRFSFDDIGEVLSHHPTDEIKAVVEWGHAQ